MDCGNLGAVPKWLRERSAKPLCNGSNPFGASYPAQVVELVDTRDLKSLELFVREGSIPSLGNMPPVAAPTVILINYLMLGRKQKLFIQ